MRVYPPQGRTRSYIHTHTLHSLPTGAERVVAAQEQPYHRVPEGATPKMMSTDLMTFLNWRAVARRRETINIPGERRSELAFVPLVLCVLPLPLARQRISTACISFPRYAAVAVCEAN